VVTLSCAYPSRGSLLLYGVVVAVGVVFLVVSVVRLCARVYLFGSWLELFGRNLSKKGWLGFSPIWGFPRINYCVLLCLLLLLLFSVYMLM
jgi:hypothetical protein